MKAIATIMLTVVAFCAAGCQKPSSEKRIVYFKFTALSVTAVINESSKTITATVPYGTNVTALAPTIIISDKASVSPASGISKNFTNPVTYTVTAEDGSQANYTVTVSVNNPSYCIVQVSANPSYGGTVSGGGSYLQGRNCTVTATANSGYTFSKWTENGIQVSTEARYSFTVNSAKTLVANFTTNSILPTVTTSNVTSVTQTTATCGGNVTDDGGNSVTARGICWSTNQNPTINDSHTTDGTGTGSFTSNITGLTQNKTYYVKAYAKSRAGTGYGEQKTFTTSNINKPTVTTNNVTNITSNSAICGGNVTDDGGSMVIERGVCWSTSQNPTIEDDHSDSGTGMGSYSLNLTGLVTNTLYYYRAYATNSAGTAYGTEKAFIPRSPAPYGAINGLFSVSATQQVYFSRGNLQYNTATNIWRFAPEQYVYQGSNNYYIFDYNDHHNNNYNGWIDLFGWGTGHNPTLHESDVVYYSTFYDWGINAISNGGNQSNRWRTLTKSEWEYVLFSRNTLSGIRFVMARLCDVEGIILLPDDWSSSIYTLSNAYPQHYANNIISTTSQWNTLQNAGAVFLPAAGWRDGIVYHYDYTSPNNTYHHQGRYWSKSKDNAPYAIEFLDDKYCGGGSSVIKSGPQAGFSVRLVRNAQ